MPPASPPLVLSTVVLFLFISLPAISQRAPENDVLKLSEDIGRWLIKTTESTQTGHIWPDDNLHPETISYDLASGVAGKVVFFAALYRATGDVEYLSQAILGADHLIELLNRPLAFDENSRRTSLYSGISGIGVALDNMSELADDDTYSASANTVVALLDSWRVEDGSGVYWSDEYNDLIYGDAGTILFLSWYGQKTGNERALNLAQLGAASLLARAEGGETEKYWRFRRSKPFNLPNFSHGTAGIGYVLASVGAATGDDSLVQGAQAAFSYIKSIAQIEDGLLQVPYGWPNESWDGLFEFGWAHGLAGNRAFFRRLQEVGIDSEEAANYERLALITLSSIGLAGRPLPPFSEPSTSLDLRFGRAGVLAAISVGAGHREADQEVLQALLWRHLESGAIRQNDLAYWQSDVPDFMGGGQAEYTGLFHGAAGIGLSLLALHAHLVGADPYFDLPDYPN